MGHEGGKFRVKRKEDESDTAVKNRSHHVFINNMNTRGYNSREADELWEHEETDPLVMRNINRIQHYDGYEHLLSNHPRTKTGKNGKVRKIYHQYILHHQGAIPKQLQDYQTWLQKQPRKPGETYKEFLIRMKGRYPGKKAQAMQLVPYNLRQSELYNMPYSEVVKRTGQTLTLPKSFIISDIIASLPLNESRMLMNASYNDVIRILLSHTNMPTKKIESELGKLNPEIKKEIVQTARKASEIEKMKMAVYPYSKEKYGTYAKYKHHLTTLPMPTHQQMITNL